MSEWKELELVDCTVNGKISYGIVQPGQEDSNGIPILRVNNFENGRLNTDSVLRVNQNIEAKHLKTRLKGGEVLLTLVGSTGQTAIVPEKLKGWNVARAVAVINVKPEIGGKWINLWLRSSIASHHLNSRANTTVQKTLNLEDVKSTPVLLPPDIERKAIEHFIFSIEDKIELNRKMNQTLEAMAQGMFKSWFVDFDPVIDNALAQGNDIPEELQARAEKRRRIIADSVIASKAKQSSQSLKPLLYTNPTLAAQFPASFVFNETLGKWIPEGWGDTDMTQCLDTISKTYKLKEVDEIIFLNTGDIEEGRFLHNHYSKTKGLPGQAKKSIQKGDILYSEIRPKNKRFAYVYFDAKDYVVSTKLMVLRPKNDVDTLFYYQILKSESTLDELQFLAESRSGTFPQITYDNLKAIRFVLPMEKGILDHFSKVLKYNFERSIENQKQIKTLTQLRDRLLPELISGRVRVREELISK